MAVYAVVDKFADKYHRPGFEKEIAKTSLYGLACIYAKEHLTNFTQPLKKNEHRTL
jgi:hypothetical protein